MQEPGCCARQQESGARSEAEARPLFRSVSDALDQAAQWDKAKVALHIIDMGGSAIDTVSAMGKMFFTMMAGFAEMERNLISERTKTALQHKKQLPVFTAGSRRWALTGRATA